MGRNSRQITAWALIIFLIAGLIFSGCEKQERPVNSEPISSSTSLNGTTAEKTAVPFNHTVMYYKSGTGSAIKSDFDARIIRSYSELTQFYNSDKDFGSSYIAGYDDDFFEENAIVLICLTRSSGSFRDRINSLSRENGRLTIDYTTLITYFFTADMKYWRVLIKVKKSDVEGITEIVPKHSEETVPNGKQFKQDSLEYLE
ncbi:MAG: hypothetical protein GX172_04315 [Clostridiales bacterium]|jgi:hypothetical protein|nr:hypothetical protein [Clostridiales bacterium]HOB36704.1 hypothetical protein [Candidatus Avimonas sp.]